MNANMTSQEIIDLFTQLPHQDPAFGRAVKIMRLAPGECVGSPYDLPENLFILIRGHLQILAFTKDGRSTATGILEAGAVWGEEALLQKETSQALCAQAIEPCIIWRLTVEQASQFIAKHPVLRLGLLRTIGRRLVQVEDRLLDVAYKQLPERVAGELLRRHKLADSDLLRISHQVLADSLGTYRETISAILRDFKREQWVDLGYRRIYIKDPQALADFSLYQNESIF